MAIKLTCECGKALQVPDTSAGKLATCPACKNQIRIPRKDAITEEPSVVKPAPAVPEPKREKQPPPRPPEVDEDENDDDDDEKEALEAEYHGPDGGKADFFCEAPDEVGAVRSAHTSLTKNVKAKSFAFRYGCAALIGGAIIVPLLIGTVIMQMVVERPLPLPAVLCGFPFLCLVILLAIFAITYQTTGFAHYCGYVGDQGCAIFKCSGDRDRITSQQMLIFEEAFKEGADVRVHTTHHLVNGSYTHTDYKYIWTDGDQREIFKVEGSHNSYNDPPPSGSSYHLAEDAELAWSVFCLKKIVPALKSGGKFRFNLQGDSYIVLRDDSLRLNLKGRKQDFDPEDIAEMRIDNGVIALKEPGARKGWFTDTGYHYFNFAELANARVFLLLMENHFDVPING